MKNIKLEPDWKRSKEQIWDNYFEKLTSHPQIAKRAFSFRYLYATAAAAIIILLTLPNFYVKTVNANRGERINHTLPDGSGVTLNSESTLKYNYLYLENLVRKLEQPKTSLMNFKRAYRVKKFL